MFVLPEQASAALAAFGRQFPCAHEAIVPAGMPPQVKCEDCGSFFDPQQLTQSRARASTHAEHEAALHALVTEWLALLAKAGDARGGLPGWVYDSPTKEWVDEAARLWVHQSNDGLWVGGYFEKDDEVVDADPRVCMRKMRERSDARLNGRCAPTLLQREAHLLSKLMAVAPPGLLAAYGVPEERREEVMHALENLGRP